MHYGLAISLATWLCAASMAVGSPISRLGKHEPVKAGQESIRDLFPTETVHAAWWGIEAGKRSESVTGAARPCPPDRWSKVPSAIASSMLGVRVSDVSHRRIPRAVAVSGSPSLIAQHIRLQV